PSYSRFSPLLLRPPPAPTLFPYTTLFRSRENAKEQQHPDAQAYPRTRAWIGHVGEEGRQVGDRRVELGLRQLSALRLAERPLPRRVQVVTVELLGGLGAGAVDAEDHRGADERAAVAGFVLDLLDLLERGAARTLQLPQHVRHADALEQGVVPAVRP